jgi:hypothetical protein
MDPSQARAALLDDSTPDDDDQGGPALAFASPAESWLRTEGDLSPEQEWQRAKGWTPLEFLTAVYHEPRARMADRLMAAKSLLEYSHKKMATVVKTIGDGSAAVNLNVSVANLSDEELASMAQLVRKAQGVLDQKLEAS